MKLIILILDGISSYSIKALAESNQTPNIKHLMGNGIYSFDCINTNKVTDTGSGLATIWSGVRNAIPRNPDPPNGEITPEFVDSLQQPINNRLFPNPFFFQYVPSGNTIAFIGGKYEYLLTNHLPQGTFLHETYNDSDAVRIQAIKDNINCDLIAAHISLPDNRGHKFDGGHTLKNPEYIKAIIQCDTWVGEIMQLCNYQNGQTRFIVTSDHGGDEDGHGKEHLAHRHTFYVDSTNGLYPYEIKVKTQDVPGTRINIRQFVNVPTLEGIAPTVLQEHYGVSPPSYMNGKLIEIQLRADEPIEKIHKQDIFC